jgi:hypothetical protein
LPGIAAGAIAAACPTAQPLTTPGTAVIEWKGGKREILVGLRVHSESAKHPILATTGRRRQATKAQLSGVSRRRPYVVERQK